MILLLNIKRELFFVAYISLFYSVFPYSEGKRDFIACAVVAQQEGVFTTPCGVCRQFLAEFAVNKDFPLYATRPLSPPFRVLCTSIMELLPKNFTLTQ